MSGRCWLTGVGGQLSQRNVQLIFETFGGITLNCLDARLSKEQSGIDSSLSQTCTKMRVLNWKSCFFQSSGRQRDVG